MTEMRHLPARMLLLASLIALVGESSGQDMSRRNARSGGITLVASQIRDIKIKRTYFEAGRCTTGELYVNGRFVAHTLELPWRNNASYVSSIPDGTFRATLRWENPLGWRIELQGTEPRTNVQIHVGNSLASTEGCVLVGRRVFNSSCTLSESQEAREMLRREFYGTGAMVSPIATVSVNIEYNVAPTRFVHSRGAFTQRGTRWQETNDAGPQFTFYFEEQSRDMSTIYVHDRARNMSLKLPLFGGMSTLLQPNVAGLNNLYSVSRQN